MTSRRCWLTKPDQFSAISGPCNATNSGPQLSAISGPRIATAYGPLSTPVVERQSPPSDTPVPAADSMRRSESAVINNIQAAPLVAGNPAAEATGPNKLPVDETSYIKDRGHPHVGRFSELATASIRVKLDAGMSPPLRALCDNGSQINLITKVAANRIGLPRRPSNLRMCGYDGIHGHKAHGMSTISVCGRFHNDVVFTTDVYIVSTLPGQVPARPIASVEDEGDYADGQWNTPCAIDLFTTIQQNAPSTCYLGPAYGHK